MARQLGVFLLIFVVGCLGFAIDESSSGLLSCFGQQISLEYTPAATASANGTLVLRTDVLRAAWSVSSMVNETSSEVVLEAQELQYDLPLPELCGCDTDAGSNGCESAVETICEQNLAPNATSICNACAGNYSDPSCAETIASLQESLDCSAEQYDEICDCLTDSSLDVCSTVTNLTQALANATCGDVSWKDGECDAAPDCAALGREDCEGSGMCGECKTSFTGDLAPSNRACWGILDECERISFTGSTYYKLNGSTYARQGEIEGRPYYMEELDEEDACGETAFYLYFNDGYYNNDQFWILDSDLDITNGAYAFNRWFDPYLWGIPDQDVQWAIGTMTGLPNSPLFDFDILATCADDALDNSLSRSLVEELFDTELRLKISDRGSYASGTWLDVCEPTVLHANVEYEDAVANVMVLSEPANRVVAWSTDVDEYIRIVDGQGLSTPKGAVILPNDTIVVADSEGVKMFHLYTGSYIGLFGDILYSRVPDNVRLSRDGQHLMTFYVTGVDRAYEYEAHNAVTGEREMCYRVAWQHETIERPCRTLDVAEDFEGEWQYVLYQEAVDGIFYGQLSRCPGFNNSAFVPVSPCYGGECEVRSYNCSRSACVKLFTDDTLISADARTIEYMPGDYLLISDSGGSIQRFSLHGDKLDNFATGYSLGLVGEFAPWAARLSPQRDFVIVSDNSYNSPMALSLQGEYIRHISGSVGFATGCSGLVVVPGMFPKWSSVTSTATSYMVGEVAEVFFDIRDSAGELWSGDVPIEATFSATIHGANTHISVVYAEVEMFGNGTAVARYVPETAGECTIDIIGGVTKDHISGSPVTVEMVPCSVDNTRSSIDVAEHTAGQTGIGTIVLRDMFGNLITDLPSSFSVTVEAQNGLLEGVEVTFNSDGTTTVSYETTLSGNHDIVVSFVTDDGEAMSLIKTVYVQPASVDLEKSILQIVSQSLVLATYEVQYDLVLQFADGYGNALTESPDMDVIITCGGLEIPVADEQDGTYSSVCVVDALSSDGKVATAATSDGLEFSSVDLDYRVEVDTVGSALFAVMTLVACVGLSLASLFLFVNTRHKKHRVFNAASPTLMAVLCGGCAVCYAAIITLGVDRSVIESFQGRDQACSARVWMLSIGFQLVFGSLFAKTWRVARIFNNQSLKKLKLTDRGLLIRIGLLVLCEIGFLILWESISPITVFASIKEETSEGVVISERCSSEYSTEFATASYVPKAVLLLFGTKMTWKARNVEQRFNESKWLSFCLYNMMFVCALVVPLLHIIGDDAVPAFVLGAGATWLCTTTVLLLLFVPKIVDSGIATIYMFDSFVLSEKSKKRTTSNSMHSAADGGFSSSRRGRVDFESSDDDGEADDSRQQTSSGFGTGHMDVPQESAVLAEELNAAKVRCSTLVQALEASLHRNEILSNQASEREDRSLSERSTRDSSAQGKKAAVLVYRDSPRAAQQNFTSDDDTPGRNRLPALRRVHQLPPIQPRGARSTGKAILTTGPSVIAGVSPLGVSFGPAITAAAPTPPQCDASRAPISGKVNLTPSPSPGVSTRSLVDRLETKET